MPAVQSRHRYTRRSEPRNYPPLAPQVPQPEARPQVEPAVVESLRQPEAQVALTVQAAVATPVVAQPAPKPQRVPKPVAVVKAEKITARVSADCRKSFAPARHATTK